MKEMLQKLKDFLFSLFKQQPPIKAEEQKVEQPKEQPKPKRKYNKQRSRDFGELLDNLELTFDSLKLPRITGSWLDKDSIIGLKKLGAHVPNPWEAKFSKRTSDITIDVTKPLPAIMCISVPNENDDEDDRARLKIMYAIKQKKLPWNVAYKAGTPYIYGAAYEFHGEMFWFHMYITISKKTGHINPCEELRQVDNVIRANGRQTYYTTKRWTPPAFLQDDLQSTKVLENTHLNMFRAMHEWWSGRDERWNVVVKKNGERVTFGINDKDTAYYFKNRDKVVSENGVTKRIVHYVREHNRVRDGKETTIKEHIRGLREFNWNGYQCNVVSPRLENKTAATFDVPGDDIEENQEKMVYLSKVGKMLADFEERRSA